MRRGDKRKEERECVLEAVRECHRGRWYGKTRLGGKGQGDSPASRKKGTLETLRGVAQGCTKFMFSLGKKSQTLFRVSIIYLLISMPSI